ncbi:MAG TPA: 16S rRNA (cytidine(1402)-2'-O)-methyltransferase [Thermoanaerobacterales bacterium]|nr:16S rRNA (cytidine(1402)-2'-O)-methyltransferase [Thermoanaerobacterales bacterium]
MEHGGVDKGILYLCATPIGNLEDITLRALRVLKEVDLIAAEDTRNTIKLLNYYDIKTPITSYHEHNKIEKGDKLIELLKSGKDIAVVSDAGTPGISDPGTDLVKKAVSENINVDIIPGASACISALTVSGLSTDRFVFEGFLPKNKKEKEVLLEKLRRETRTIILYEAPHRLAASLRTILKILGNREIAVVRELTKMYQEVFRGNMKEAIEKFNTDKPRGEFTLVIAGNEEVENNDANKWEGLSVEEHILMYMKSGKSKKEAVKLTARDRGIPKNKVYKSSITIKEGQ